MKFYEFKEAVPVWEKGKECEKNYNLIFHCNVPQSENTILCISAANLYQLFINGKMVAEGPARAGHGYYRVDEIDISEHLNRENNKVSIFVNGYGINSYYLINQKPFLCAEIIEGGKVTHATGVCGFSAIYNSIRKRKVIRYTRQRTFAEAYVCSEENNKLFLGEGTKPRKIELAKTEKKKFIERQVPYPSYDYEKFTSGIKKGTIKLNDNFEGIKNDIIEIENHKRGFYPEELEINNADEVERFCYIEKSDHAFSVTGDNISPKSYSIYEMNGEKTGFIKLDIECSEDTTLAITFDEILTDGDVLSTRGCMNSVLWSLEKGRYSLVTVEPYSLKFVKIINTSENATVTVNDAGVVKYEFNCKVNELDSGDSVLDSIFNAAVETFKQNTIDIYMDCPSRERAGWLCDSYFTARTEYYLTGKSEVEKNFLENFIYTDGFVGIPDGMLPMCYPADFRNNLYIPQWSMWYVLELEAYFKRSGDIELINAAKEKMYKLAHFFKKYENENSLLENIESWSFIEWSKTRDFMDGVNYPTNMLYARMLKALSNLYSDKNLFDKAEQIEEEIRKRSFFDGFFHDHALRDKENNLVVQSGDITETCQYYAFFMGTANSQLYPVLWKTLVEDFGPDREETKLWENVHPSNAFTGYCLRLDLLSKAGENERLLNSIKGFYGYMAEETGTLWEHKSKHASCNHGFASQVLVWLKNIL